MTDVTVKSFAAEMHVSIDYLMQQLADIGINKKTAMDFVTNQEKEIFLFYMNRYYSGDKSNKLILQRKTHSTLNISSTGGKSKSIKIEVRKKKTYVQSILDVKDRSTETISNNKTEKLVHQEFVHKGYKEKINDLTANSIVPIITDFIKSTNDNNNIINNSPNIIEESFLKAEMIEIKRNAENELLYKVEKKVCHDAEEIRCIPEKHVDSYDNLSENIEENTVDYHITTSYHAREAEDENDRKLEVDHRGRFRSGRLNKKKKSNLLSETKSNYEEERVIVRSNKRKRKNSAGVLIQSFTKPFQAINRDVVIGKTITIAELANKMAVKGSQVIKVMMKLGIMVTINQVIDQSIAQLVVEEIGHKAILRCDNELEELLMSDRDVNTSAVAELRAPVVTIMGHVDHGKTSLLDCIRSTKVADGEMGGITQHIGAYYVETKNGMITFLDTPGHAFFTAMRARGAQATDIIILVVAADDGVMPQTIEAIQHAKAANVPIIVAINKIDKLESNLDRIKNELSQYKIIPEEWGGESQFVYVSAKTGVGINSLLDAILLQAEMLELKAVRSGMASGIVIESSLDKGRGPVATVLVLEGTLNCGDVILCGLEYGRIRAMRDSIGRNIISAFPSIPVEILGLSGVSVAGDKLIVVRDEKRAREVAIYRQSKFREIKLARKYKSNLDNVFSDVTESKITELNIVLKTDVQGSVEAIIDALKNLSIGKVRVKIIGSGVGRITETDAMLAVASNAILLGFNVRADISARHVIEAENLTLRYYSVIYDLINEIKQTMSGIISPEYKQKIIGLVEVRNIFRSPKFGIIAGCMVVEGLVKRYNKIHLLRDNIVIYEGELDSLRRFKDDVNEVRNGLECGIGIKNYNDIKLGDLIEVFETIEIKRAID